MERQAVRRWGWGSWEKPGEELEGRKREVDWGRYWQTSDTGAGIVPSDQALLPASGTDTWIFHLRI